MSALIFSYFANACWVLAALFAIAFVFRLTKGEDWLGMLGLAAVLFLSGLGLRYLTMPENLPASIAQPLANAGVIAPSVTLINPPSSPAANAVLPPANVLPSTGLNGTQLASVTHSANSWVSDVPTWLQGLLPPALRDPNATAQAFNQLLVSPAWQRLLANQAFWQQFPAMNDQEILNSPDVLILLNEPGVVHLLDIWSGNSNPTVAERSATLVKLLREAATSGNSLQPNMPLFVALPALFSAIEQGDVMPVIASPYGQMLLSSVLPGDWTFSFSQSGNKFSLPPALGGDPSASQVIVPNAKVYRFQMPDGSWRFSSIPPSDGRPYEEVQQQ